ncbi:unnamed protein product [Cochlearia groenlandica]
MIRAGFVVEVGVGSSEIRPSFPIVSRPRVPSVFCSVGGWGFGSSIYSGTFQHLAGFSLLDGTSSTCSTYGSRVVERVPASENAPTCFLYDRLCELHVPTDVIMSALRTADPYLRHCVGSANCKSVLTSSCRSRLSSLNGS